MLENYLISSSPFEEADISKWLDYYTLNEDYTKLLSFWEDDKSDKEKAKKNKEYNTLGAYIIGEANRKYGDKFDGIIWEYVERFLPFNRLPDPIAKLVWRLAEEIDYLKTTLKLVDNVVDSDLLNKEFLETPWDETFENLRPEILRLEIEPDKENRPFELVNDAEKAYKNWLRFPKWLPVSLSLTDDQLWLFVSYKKRGIFWKNDELKIWAKISASDEWLFHEKHDQYNFGFFYRVEF